MHPAPPQHIPPSPTNMNLDVCIKYIYLSALHSSSRPTHPVRADRTPSHPIPSHLQPSRHIPSRPRLSSINMYPVKHQYHRYKYALTLVSAAFYRICPFCAVDVLPERNDQVNNEQHKAKAEAHPKDRLGDLIFRGPRRMRRGSGTPCSSSRLLFLSEGAFDFARLWRADRGGLGSGSR